ncbi:MAG: hypothetical protein JO170_25500 [Verrucomicrobia bacterium]|nr:hypothetical protein [Verrucomicrobiota bacterium]
MSSPNYDPKAGISLVHGPIEDLHHGRKRKTEGHPHPCSCLLIQLLLWGLLSSCAHVVKISYSPEALIHPAFNRPVTLWQGERVELELTPALRGPALNYLVNHDQVLLANAIRQRGLRHEYNVPGKGAPIVVYGRNPNSNPQENIIPAPASFLA